MTPVSLGSSYSNPNKCFILQIKQRLIEQYQSATELLFSSDQEKRKIDDIDHEKLEILLQYPQAARLYCVDANDQLDVAIIRREQAKDLRSVLSFMQLSIDTALIADASAERFFGRK